MKSCETGPTVYRPYPRRDETKQVNIAQSLSTGVTQIIRRLGRVYVLIVVCLGLG